jgi:HK97 gp10 family phage protein
VSTTTIRLDRRAIEAWAAGGDADAVLRDLGEQIVSDAQRDAPKDTGEGAASIQYELGHDSRGSFVRVSWDRKHFYMMFQELGTSQHTARPFLRPAALKHRSL